MTTRCFSPPLSVRTRAPRSSGAGGGQRLPRDGEIVRALELERAEMRIASHQHDVEHGEVEGGVRFLRHDGDPPRQLAARQSVDAPPVEHHRADRGVSAPRQQLSSVVLPEPFGPSRPTIAPRSTSSDTSSRTSRRAPRRDRRRTRRQSPAAWPQPVTRTADAEQARGPRASAHGGKDAMRSCRRLARRQKGRPRWPWFRDVATLSRLQWRDRVGFAPTSRDRRGYVELYEHRRTPQRSEYTRTLSGLPQLRLFA